MKQGKGTGKAHESSLLWLEMNCCYDFWREIQLFYKAHALLQFLFNNFNQKDHSAKMSLVNTASNLQQVPAFSCLHSSVGMVERWKISLKTVAGQGKAVLVLCFVGEVPQRIFLEYYITGKFSRDYGFSLKLDIK